MRRDRAVRSSQQTRQEDFNLELTGSSTTWHNVTPDPDPDPRRITIPRMTSLSFDLHEVVIFRQVEKTNYPLDDRAIN